MCYFLAWGCFIVSVSLCLKGRPTFVDFLIAAILFGFFGMIFEVSVRNSKYKLKAMVETLVDMSPEQIKEVLQL